MDFKFPDVGEGITEGKLVEWKVKVGDLIKADDIIASVETDKAVVEIPTPNSGVVESLLFNPGDTLYVGKVIMTLNENASVESPKEEVKTEEVVEAPKVENPIVSEKDIELPKVDNPVVSEKVVEPIKEEIKAEPISEVSTNHINSNNSGDILAMPAVRHEANLKGIDLSTIKGSGHNGQILMGDLGNESTNTVNSNPVPAEDKTIDAGTNSIDISESDLKMAELPVAPPKEEVVIPDHIKENIQEIDVSDIKEKELTASEAQKQEVGENEIEPIDEEVEDPVIQALKEKNMVANKVEPVETTESESNSSPKNILATPSVRKLARELGIDINFVLGSGENGKITEEDIKRAKENKDKLANNKPTETKAVVENKEVTVKEGVQETVNSEVEETKTEEIKPSFDIKEKIVPEVKNKTNVNLDVKPSAQTLSKDMRVPFTSIRSIISSKMLESLQKSAQVTMSDEANITELVKIRNEQKARLSEKGIKLSYVSFFIKAYSEACKEFPYFNATVDDATKEIVLKSEVNCGVAVDTPKGLLVPVIKNTDSKSIIELSKDINDIANRGREGKINPQEMSGSSFTISSVGNLSGQVFTPILNYPEVALLGIGRIIKKPIVVSTELGDEISIASMVTLSLTFDHRAVDGADAARFLKKLMELLENPDLLFMEA